MSSNNDNWWQTIRNVSNGTYSGNIILNFGSSTNTNSSTYTNEVRNWWENSNGR